MSCTWPEVRGIKINYRQSRLKRSAPRIKLAQSSIRKTAGGFRDVTRGRGSLTTSVISDERSEDEHKKSSQNAYAMDAFDAQVMKFLSPHERKAYAKLSDRERKKLKSLKIRNGSGSQGTFQSKLSHTSNVKKASNIKYAVNDRCAESPGNFRRRHTADSENTDYGRRQAGENFKDQPMSGSQPPGTGRLRHTTSTASMTSSGHGTATTGTGEKITGAANVTVRSTTASSAGATAAGVTTGAVTGAATGGVSIAVGAVTKAAQKAAERFRDGLEAQAAAAEKEVQMSVQNNARADAADQSSNSTHSTQQQISIGTFVKAVMGAVTVFISSFFSTIASIILLPILLVIALIAAIVSVIFVGVATDPRGGGSNIIAVAQAEADAWEENIGGKKYKDWYGMDTDWCAIFISWCADQCGYIDSGLFPKSASVAVIKNYFDSIGAFRGKGSYEPQAGDLIIYGSDGSSHIGLVVAYDSTAKMITTIEGNTGSSDVYPYHSGSRVREKRVSLSYSWIHGFCLPAYPVEVGNLTGNTNCQQAFNYFVAMGYTQEAAAGIVGNLMQESGLTASGDLAVNVTGYDGAVGICMWTYPSIKQSFLNFAAAQGEPWPQTSLKVQLDFLAMNMTQSGIWMWTSYAAGYYPASANISLTAFKHCTDIDQATTAFCAMYEKPNGDLAMLDRRKQFARRVYNSYAK